MSGIRLGGGSHETYRRYEQGTTKGYTELAIMLSKFKHKVKAAQSMFDLQKNSDYHLVYVYSEYLIRFNLH